MPRFLTLECTPELIIREMADCGSSSSAQPLPKACPSCRLRGLSVNRRTVKALLTESALRRVRMLDHRFCRTAACPVVYYDEAGGVYEQPDVRARVWQKEPSGDRPLCYCFGETEAGIRLEFERDGTCLAVERVRADIDAERCACDVRNPRGACCFGDLIAAVTRIRCGRSGEGAMP